MDLGSISGCSAKDSENPMTALFTFPKFSVASF